ncbi:uncharacterized protein LOC120133763 [Hibiscus syriacus]|uniref:uncharacterized protein LOC120133763 n=1 Tax=Hibiscus syriacus TaxID=106335 RepID=UPI0019220B64|nr:uncharacterized protein LOC120133763 [Hibiscus syriacus]
MELILPLREGEVDQQRVVAKVLWEVQKKKFEVLNSIDPESLLVAEDSGKKQRVASLGVTKIIQDLKLKKKEHVEKQKKVLKWARSCRISILCMLETRVKESNAGDIVHQNFSDWDSCCNYNHSTNGRIWTLWHRSLNCTILSVFDQSISLKSSFRGKEFVISAVYGLNEGCPRRQLWNQLSSVGCTVGKLPWLIGGDFNVILNTEESSTTVSAATNADISEFHNCVDDLGVFDHPYTDSRGFLGSLSSSDLAPAVGNPAQVLFYKLKRLKGCLKELNREYFNDISNRVKLNREDLMNIQLANLNSAHSSSNIASELEIGKELQALEEAELLFYKQKAKADWINEGDQRTRFFHSMVACKRKSNTIRVLYNQDELRLDTFEDFSNEVIDFFQRQLGVADRNITGSNV